MPDQNTNHHRKTNDPSAEEVVHSILKSLQAHYTHQLTGLQVLLTDFPNPYADQFIETCTLMKAKGSDEIIAWSHLRRIIAKRLAETTHPEGLLEKLPPHHCG